jgi:hypothetical protein
MVLSVLFTKKFADRVGLSKRDFVYQFTDQAMADLFFKQWSKSKDVEKVTR